MGQKFGYFMSQKEQHITLPLHDLIFCILGDDLNGLECAVVSPTVGLVLDNLLKDSLKWKVEFNDWDGNPLKLPVLWRFADWRSSSDRYNRMREYEAGERLKTNIEQENIRRIKQVLMTKHSLSENYAQMLAYKLLRSGSAEAIDFFGVKELAMKEEDINPPRPSKFWRGYLKG